MTATTSSGGSLVDSADRVKHPLEEGSGAEKTQTGNQLQDSGGEDGERSSEEEKDEVDEKQEKETDEKDEDQKQTPKNRTDGDAAKQSKGSKKKKKRNRNKNNNAQSSEGPPELPLPTPATEDHKPRSSPQKQQGSYAGAVKTGALGQRERNVNI